MHSALWELRGVIPTDSGEPSMVKGALSGPNVDNWRMSMDQELGWIWYKDTFIDDVPHPGTKLIRTRLKGIAHIW